MKPAPFEYAAPGTVAEAVTLLGELSDEEPKVLAGGQSLVPMMNLRLARPTHLVDINRVGGLHGISVVEGEVRIGALTRHSDIEDSGELNGVLPLLPAMASHIGYRQIRYRGTIGGSCCHADPVGEWPMATRALDARFDVSGPDGARTIDADDFYVTIFTPAVEPDEILTAVRIPVPAPPWGWGFSEFARKAGDFAVVAATAVIEAVDGSVATARLAIAGAGSTPLRSPGAEGVLAGAALDDGSAVARAADAAADEVEPPSDHHGSAAFRRELVRVEARRALGQAMLRAATT